MDAKLLSPIVHERNRIADWQFHRASSTGPQRLDVGMLREIAAAMLRQDLPTHFAANIRQPRVEERSVALYEDASNGLLGSPPTPTDRHQVLHVSM